MQFVCNDKNGNSKWYYETGRYFRFMPDGSLRYSLRGENLADPEKIVNEGKQPQTSTIKVFEHWQSVKDMVQ